jgi:hypothetical protein
MDEDGFSDGGDVVFDEITPGVATDEDVSLNLGNASDSEDFANHSPLKKTKNSSQIRNPGGGRKKGSTSTKQVNVLPMLMDRPAFYISASFALTTSNLCQVQ